MTPRERAIWAMNQAVTDADRDNAADLLRDYMEEKDHAAAFEMLVAWVFKIRVEGGLAVLSQIPAELLDEAVAAGKAHEKTDPDWSLFCVVDLTTRKIVAEN